MKETKNDISNISNKTKISEKELQELWIVGKIIQNPLIFSKEELKKLRAIVWIKNNNPTLKDIVTAIHRIPNNKIDFSNYTYNWKKYDLSAIYDKEWNLKSRELLKSSEITNWYKTIEELFRKMSIMTDTQIEPNFPPQYVWEIYKNKKVPTYIIVWDMHADWYNVQDDELKKARKIYWKNIIIDDDESSEPEISSISTIKTKFNINNIWLENISNGAEWESFLYWIANWLNKQEIDFYWLEIKENRKKVLNEMNKEFKGWIFVNLKIIQSLWINLKTLNNINEKEFIRLSNKYNKILNNDGYRNNVTLPFLEVLNSNFDQEYNNISKLKNNELKEIGQIYLYIYSRLFWNENLKSISWILWPILSKKELRENMINNNKKYHKIIIEERNKNWINFIESNMWKDNIWVMVYWKAHITDLINQINKKNNWIANIYVAK